MEWPRRIGDCCSTSDVPPLIKSDVLVYQNIKPRIKNLTCKTTIHIQHILYSFHRIYPSSSQGSHNQLKYTSRTFTAHLNQLFFLLRETGFYCVKTLECVGCEQLCGYFQAKYKMWSGLPVRKSAVVLLKWKRWLKINGLKHCMCF